MALDVTPAMLVGTTGCSPIAAAMWAVPLDDAAKEFELDTPARLPHFLAATAHESAQFTRVRESMAYSVESMMRMFRSRIPNREMAAQFIDANGRTRQAALANYVYAGRNGNGPAASGDGARFIGRGLIQITGRGNYRDCERATGIACVLHPELLEQPPGAARSAAWYFARYCAPAADRGDAAGVVRAINSGEPPDRLRARVAAAERAVAAMAAMA